jgi:hypothetical protein
LPVIHKLKAGVEIFLPQDLPYIVRSDLGDRKPHDLGSVSLRIDADHDLKEAINGGDSPKRTQYQGIAASDGLQQASPWEMNMYLVGGTVQFFWEIFYRRLDE